MKRIATIIGVPDSPHGQLPGVEVDLSHYRDFLHSIGGGAWLEEEIRVLRSPSRVQVLAATAAAQFADYAIVVFSGHGFHARSATLSETTVCLAGHDEARLSELFPCVRRVLVIADCCRMIVSVNRSMNEAVLANAALANEVRTIDRATARHNFETAIMGCEEGRIVLYACDVHQSAGDDRSSGGCFSSNLLGKAEKWSARARAGAVLDVRNAYTEARQATARANYPQDPQMEAGRRIGYFPFAIGEQLNTTSSLLYG